MQHRNLMYRSNRNKTMVKLIFSSVIGAALVLMMGDRGWAQNNQSDISGPSTTEPPPSIPNQSDISGPSTTEPPPLLPETETRSPGSPGNGGDDSQPQDVLEVATELSARLQRARLACTESRQAVADLPRRFARGTVDANVICSSLQCEEFRVVTQEVQSFLDSLDRAQIQQLEQRDLRLW